MNVYGRYIGRHVIWFVSVASPSITVFTPLFSHLPTHPVVDVVRSQQISSTFSRLRCNARAGWAQAGRYGELLQACDRRGRKGQIALVPSTADLRTIEVARIRHEWRHLYGIATALRHVSRLE